jgi:hypothetical protein
MHLVSGFMRKHGYYLSSSEIDRLWLRFDRDQDGVLSYTEFVELVLPYESSGRNLIETGPLPLPRVSSYTP